MPVKLWTGLPGAGKTACMVAAILKFKKENPDRAVFAININGLHESVAQPLKLDELRKWWELPPGSLICIDECQEDDFFPLDRGQPAEWVKRISKVRHEGMDFWMTTQHPTLMSGYVRRLVDQHVHSVRKFNTKVVDRYTWGRCMDNCEKGSAQKAAVHEWGTLPSEVFDLYKSSNAHNMKRRVPLRAYVLPVSVLVALVAIIAIPYTLHRMKANEKARIEGGVPAGSSASATAGRGDPDAALRREDYAKWTRPRVDGVPWSAPMFDGLTVQAEPRLFCIAVDDGRCTCATEQGTRYEVKAAMCRTIARDGLYNPFLRQQDDAQRVDRRQAPPTPGQPQARPAAGPAAVVASAGTGWPAGVGSQSYTPPAAPGSWNADPFGSKTAN